jgi:hypothetical protein
VFCSGRNAAGRRHFDGLGNCVSLTGSARIGAALQRASSATTTRMSPSRREIWLDRAQSSRSSERACETDLFGQARGRLGVPNSDRANAMSRDDDIGSGRHFCSRAQVHRLVRPRGGHLPATSAITSPGDHVAQLAAAARRFGRPKCLLYASGLRATNASLLLVHK